MEYKLKVYNIWEYGQRKDVNGNPHQEDCTFPLPGKATDADRLFILCDGMGGHDAGEIASSTVCEAMSLSILKAQPDPEGDFSDKILQKAISDAFSALDEKDTGAAKKMGTTMTLLKLYNGGCVIAHMGDSRVYHIRPGKVAADTKILFQTRDHSLINDLIAVGELTEEEAKHSRQKNVITRAMQPNMERRPKADVYHATDIKPGDYFYLCSDGMLENMENPQICYNFSDAAGTDEEKVERLIKATQENRDNHTAIIVHILDVFTSVTKKSSESKKAVAASVSLMGEVHDDTPEVAASNENSTETIVTTLTPTHNHLPTSVKGVSKSRCIWIIAFVVALLAIVIVACVKYIFFEQKTDEPLQEQIMDNPEKHQQVEEPDEQSIVPEQPSIQPIKPQTSPVAIPSATEMVEDNSTQSVTTSAIPPIQREQSTDNDEAEVVLSDDQAVQNALKGHTMPDSQK